MYDIRNQFPDYDLATLPPIPSDWKDVSWCNDVCPSFENGEFVIFVDYVNPEDREFSDWHRFFIHHYLENGDAVCVLMTDEWAEILNYF